MVIHYQIRKDYFSYKIVNGRIYTDYVEQVAVIDGNNLVSDVSFQQILGEVMATQNLSARRHVPVENFTQLTDTPSDYTGFAGYAVAVKDTEDGLEFIEVSSGGNSRITNLCSPEKVSFVNSLPDYRP